MQNRKKGVSSTVFSVGTPGRATLIFSISNINSTGLSRIYRSRFNYCTVPRLQVHRPEGTSETTASRDIERCPPNHHAPKYF